MESLGALSGRLGLYLGDSLKLFWDLGPSCRVELSWGRRGPILNRLGTLMEHLGPVRAARLGRLGALSDRLELHLGAP